MDADGVDQDVATPEVVTHAVNGAAGLMRGFGRAGSWMQSGRVGTYAWVLVVGVLAVLGAFTFR